MHPMLSAFRLVAALLFLLPAAVASAQDTTPEPWQDVITHQIEAFRHGDAVEAFSYAGASFQDSFPSAAAFFRTIVGSGYSPIMTSTSHSFGAYQRVAPDGVVQVVKFVGPHQELFEAIYELSEEETGWRVQGVMLGQPKGIGI